MRLYVAIFFIPLFLMFMYATINMIPQYHRSDVFRLGKVKVPKGPYGVVIVPVLERTIRIAMRTITHDVPGRDTITNDNVSGRVRLVFPAKTQLCFPFQ
jgi:regulator of protease activity HflC (stomatin/prohibitin superfamily)